MLVGIAECSCLYLVHVSTGGTRKQDTLEVWKEGSGPLSINFSMVTG